jgi:hypothetical protein
MLVADIMAEWLAFLPLIPVISFPNLGLETGYLV